MRPYGLALLFFGILLCYLALELVRWVTFTMLFHWGGIAALLAAGCAVYLYRSLRRD